MPLKNLIREDVSRHGQASWSLKTLNGEPVDAFTSYCAELDGYALATRKRYAEVVSRFLDYLFEAGVFSSQGVDAKQLNAAIDAYPILLRDGSDGLIRRIDSRNSSAADEWLVQVARGLKWGRLKPGSFSNTLAAVNRLLVLSETLARQELERARILGLPHAGLRNLIKALGGSVPLSSREIVRMRQNSMLGSVAKMHPKGIRRPRRLALPGERQQEDRREKNFPIAYLQSVVNAARHWRDKALWLLLAASGIRISEARNLLLRDVDFELQRVYVIDPANHRFALPSHMLEEPRFKGRSMAATYLFPPLRQQFFYALGQYLETEFVAVRSEGEPQYLFQCVEPKRRGLPLIDASDAAMNPPFKAAAKRAGVPLASDGSAWTLHSLRHLYGDHMLNDYPIAPDEGRFGLPLTDVQMLMGHASIRSTEKYARPKAARLLARLQASDEAMLGLTDKERQLLPSSMLERSGVAVD